MKNLVIKSFLLLSLLFLGIGEAQAVPAHGSSFTHQQPDGTVLTLRLVGDEYMHYYLNENDGTKMQQGADGHYYPISDMQVSDMTESANVRRSEAQQRRMQRLPARRLAPGAPNKAIGTFGNMTGSKKGIVILVNFADKTMTGTQTEFYNMFNKEGYNTDGHIGSVADYFKAQSYNQFNLSFDVVGPVTLSNNMAYYGENNSSGSDKNPGAMVKEACVGVKDLVNFADYDWDSDGYVDQVFVIYAGYGENYGADSNTIWPHEWDLTSAKIGALSVDGVKVNTYACCAELCGTSGKTLNGVGTACHEFSHCLGYPDLYDTDGETNGSGFGMSYYDLMAGGSYNGPNANGEVPCGYSAYERWMAGWITPTELTEAASISGMVTIDNETNGGKVVSNSSTLANSPSRAYMIKNGSDNDYYLLENRPNTGYFKYFRKQTSGSGLFITHVKYDATAWKNNKVNANSSDQLFTFVPADGTQSTSNYTTDFFPTTNVKSFSEVSSKSVTNIAKSSGLISFDFMGGYEDDGSRYTITFNAGAGSCTTTSWKQTEYKQSCQLPTPTISVAGWEFAGWTTSAVSAETSTAPSFKESTYCPAADITLYAVYKKTTQIGGDSKFYKNATLSALTKDTKYIFVAADGYALDASEINGTANSSITGTAVSVVDGAVTTTNDNLIWTCASVAGSSVELKNGSNYLRVRSTGLSKSTSTSNDLKWTSNTGLCYTASKTYSIKFNDTNKTFGTAQSVDANTRVYAFVRTSQATDVTVYLSNPKVEETPDPVSDSTFGTYYSSHSSSLDGKNGQSLELALSAVIYPHTKRSYDNLWTDFKTTDVVPNTTEQVYDMYSNNTYYYSTADHNTDFNREHSVPNSWWGGESGNAIAYTDLHHLVPSDVKANSKKSNYPLGCGHGLQNALQSSADNSEAILWSFASTGSDSYGGGSGYVWEPEDQYKGDFARMYLYVVCAYEGNITWQTNYMFTSDANNYTTIKPWAKELLLKWHRQDPVSTKERARNNAVYGIQENRNPFIDYPELVEYIWGEKSAQSFSLSSAVSAYSQAYITAYPDVADTGNGGVCDNGGTPDPGTGDDDDPVTPPVEKVTPVIYYPHIAHLGKPFTAPALTKESNGTLTYSSSNAEVATVDAETGAVTIKAVGTAIITVQQAASGNYEATSASYMIKVVE